MGIPINKGWVNSYTSCWQILVCFDIACVAGGIVFARVVLAAKPPFSRLCHEKRASPPHSLRGFFSSTKPKLCARERSRRLRRLALTVCPQPSCRKEAPRVDEFHFQNINNGNRTEWSPIRSVIIRVINKIGRPRSGSLICLTSQA